MAMRCAPLKDAFDAAGVLTRRAARRKGNPMSNGAEALDVSVFHNEA